MSIMDLNIVREKIDSVDRQIIGLLNERVRLAGEVGQIKKQNGAPIYVPSREEQVMRKLVELNEGPLAEETIRRIYREIISASIALEKALVIAYLGPEATYTHQAAMKNFGSSLDYRAMPTIPDVFTSVNRREADYGVIPIENSTGGAVLHSLDMLAETDLKIVAQIYLPIEHCLITRTPMEEIREIHSKDQALLQCRDWLQRHLPKARLIDCSSTAEAVKLAANEPGIAAIASEVAAQQYDVPILVRAIQDKMDNVTRFLVIGRESAPPTGSGLDRTSMVISINDEVGALEKALHPFSSRGINLTKIESRPSRRKAWDYVFFIDFDGHWEDVKIQDAVTELKNRCPLVKWLGSYPKAR